MIDSCFHIHSSRKLLTFLSHKTYSLLQIKVRVLPILVYLVYGRNHYFFFISYLLPTLEIEVVLGLQQNLSPLVSIFNKADACPANALLSSILPSSTSATFHCLATLGPLETPLHLSFIIRGQDVATTFYPLLFLCVQTMAGLRRVYSILDFSFGTTAFSDRTDRYSQVFLSDYFQVFFLIIHVLLSHVTTDRMSVVSFSLKQHLSNLQSVGSLLVKTALRLWKSLVSPTA